MVILTIQSLLLLSTLVILVSQFRLIESLRIHDDSSNPKDRSSFDTESTTTTSYRQRELDTSTTTNDSMCQLCSNSIWKVHSCRLGSVRNEDMFGTYMVPKQTEPCYEDTCCASQMSECCSPSSTSQSDSDVKIDEGSIVNEESDVNNSSSSMITTCDLCDKVIFHIHQCRDGTAMDPDMYGTFKMIKNEQSTTKCYEYTCCAWNMHDCCISTSDDGLLTDSDDAKWEGGILVAFILLACVSIFVIILIRIKPFRSFCSDRRTRTNNDVVSSNENNNSKHSNFVVVDGKVIQNYDSDDSTVDHTIHEDDNK